MCNNMNEFVALNGDEQELWEIDYEEKELPCFFYEIHILQWLVDLLFPIVHSPDRD